MNVVDRYTSSFVGDNFIFMNDGYVDLDDHGYPVDNYINLLPKYSNWRYQVNLYRKMLDVANVTPHTSKGNLVDISCGKGGGLSFYKDYYNFDSLAGVDITPIHIEFCNDVYDDIDFYLSSATNLPFSDESVDILTTVEACLYYDPFEQYVSECYRVLKPGGLLIQAAPGLPPLSYYEDYFTCVSVSDITKNVATSCAISKHRFVNINDIYRSVLEQDEKRYLDNSSFYNIAVYQKMYS